MAERQPPPIRTTRGPDAPPPRARPDRPLPEAVVAVWPARLDPGQRALAARAAGVSGELVDTLAAAGLPLVLEEAERLALARGRAATLARELPGAQALRPGSVMPALALPVLGAVAVLSVVAGAVAALALGVLVAALVLGAGAVAGLGVAVGAAAMGVQEQARFKEAITLQREAEGAALPPDTRAAALLRRAATLRARLAAAELPDLARDDLDASLDALAADLPGLARREAEGEDLSATLEAVSEALDALDAGFAAPEDDTERLARGAERLRAQARAAAAGAEELGEARRRAARAKERST